ncbi:hypothetical protein [Hydrogenophaga palleronii]|uniref:hypothetical protein n=1 Tax=Hydrogenophaga palleronii TaxID=65655 RepID=UPI000825FBCD|nr:hypothetical protein [Hydrogenophaga palleronii]
MRLIRSLRALCISFSMCLLGAAAAQGLPPAMEADRLLQIAATEMDKQDGADWKTVATALRDAEATGARMPVNFAYHYGRALHAVRQHAAAQQQLERYLREQGTKARYYSEALQQYSSVQVALAAERAALEQQAEIERSWTWFQSRWRGLGQHDCDQARGRVSAISRRARAINCDCDVEVITDHPNYRGMYRTTCEVRWQGNRLLDKHLPTSQVDRDYVAWSWQRESGESMRTGPE